MAGGSIGSVNVDIIKGLSADLKMVLETWTVPGVAGVGAMQLGASDGEYQLQTCTYCVDQPTAAAHVAAMEALQGTLVTIVDQWGQTFTNHLVKKVDTADAKKAIIDVNGPDSVHVTINLVLTAT